jgi:hypothetical protein
MMTTPPLMTPPPTMRMPITPVSAPLKLMLRRRTVLRTSAAAKLSKATLMPLLPLLRIEANTSWQSMVIDLVMVTAPKPPGSRQLISPFTAVLTMAPAKVLHGAVRLQGSASLPTPETQVRVLWACAGMAASRRSEVAAKPSESEMRRMMSSGLRLHLIVRPGCGAARNQMKRCTVDPGPRQNWCQQRSRVRSARLHRSPYGRAQTPSGLHAAQGPGRKSGCVARPPGFLPEHDLFRKPVPAIWGSCSGAVAVTAIRSGWWWRRSEWARCRDWCCPGRGC